MCEIGDINICRHCSGEIVFKGSYWDHPGESKPRHPAEPREIIKPARSTMLEVLRLEINKLELKPADVLVVKFPEDATSSDIWDINKSFSEALPKDVKAIILVGNIQIYTISRDEQWLQVVGL